MDNSVGYNNIFQNYSDREFWAKYSSITRIVYNWCFIWKRI